MNIKNRFEGVGAALKGSRKQLFMMICIASVIVALGIFVLLINGFVNRHYDNYEVVRVTQRQDTNTEQYICQDGRLIKYSKDGISEITIEGNTVWTGSYDMSNPRVVTCDNYVVVADIGGKDAYIYNGEDTGVEISTDYEIKQASVSGQGLVALLLQDASSDVINIYNPYDISSSLLVEIPTNVEDGYPVTMEISEDGTSLVASYICVTSGKAQSRVAFYNFSEVGQNTDCLVGAKNYTDVLITDIEFLADDQVCLFGDNGYYIWKNMKQPKQISKKKVKGQIRSVFYNKKKIGMIMDTGNEKQPYRMQIYDLKGTKETDFTFASDYDNVTLVDNEILMYSAKTCYIYRLNGVQRFKCNVDEGVSYFFKGKRRGRYYLLNDSQIQEIKLTNK